MSFATTPRERRLWIWVGVVLLAIYATMGLQRTLADAFAGTGVGAILFVVSCLAVLTAVVTRGLSTRPGLGEIAMAVGIVAVYVLVFVRMAVPTERSHLVEYGVVALLVREALLERASHGGRVPLLPLLAIVTTSVVGAIDELIQLAVPGRYFDPLDIAFNVLAAVMAVAASEALARVRRLVG